MTYACVCVYMYEQGLPPIFASMVFPLLTSGEVVASYTWSRKREKSMTSMTFSSLYSGVMVNNCLVLAVFLFALYVQKLRWTFSAEMTSLLLVTSVVGTLGSFYTTYKVYWAFLVAPLFFVTAGLTFVFQMQGVGCVTVVSWVIFALIMVAIIITILSKEVGRRSRSCLLACLPC